MHFLFCLAFEPQRTNIYTVLFGLLLFLARRAAKQPIETQQCVGCLRLSIRVLLHGGNNQTGLERLVVRPHDRCLKIETWDIWVVKTYTFLFSNFISCI